MQRDAGTVKRWLSLLEGLYIVFPVRPYHRNIARSILKEPKYYFYDTALVHEEARFENLCACALLKELQSIADCQGRDARLHYLRTKDGRELDFAVFAQGRPPLLIEAKLSDDTPSPAFGHFTGFFPKADKLQLVRNLKKEKTYPNGVEIRKASTWLARLEL